MKPSVTMDEIAARAGVSRGAVSLALRNSPKISGKTTEHIQRIASEFGYRPNLNASRLARAEQTTVGILVSDLHNPITADIVDGFVLSEDRESNPDTYLASGFNSPERERAAVESFLSNRVKGIVLIGSLLPTEQIRDLGRHTPTVVVGRQIEGLDCVYVNSNSGGRLAAEHLVDLGHRQLAHLTGGTGAGSQSRRAGFAERVKELTGTSPILVDGDYTQKAGHRGALSLFSREDPPTGLFAANDLMALGVLGAAREIGLEAGKDFSLLGFDDISIAAFDYIALSTITYSRKEMGETAREMLLRRCKEPELEFKHVELEPELVFRKTSGPLQHTAI